MADVRPRDLKKAPTPEVKREILDAAYTAMEADLPDHAEDCIVRAATFTPQDVDELTEPLAYPLRSIIRRLIQRNPEDRYQSAAALEADLREDLASLAVPHGATEALKEVYGSLMGAT